MLCLSLNSFKTYDNLRALGKSLLKLKSLKNLTLDLSVFGSVFGDGLT